MMLCNLPVCNILILSEHSSSWLSHMSSAWLGKVCDVVFLEEPLPSVYASSSIVSELNGIVWYMHYWKTDSGKV